MAKKEFFGFSQEFFEIYMRSLSSTCGEELTRKLLASNVHVVRFSYNGVCLYLASWSTVF